MRPRSPDNTKVVGAGRVGVWPAFHRAKPRPQWPGLDPPLYDQFTCVGADFEPYKSTVESNSPTRKAGLKIYTGQSVSLASTLYDDTHQASLTFPFYILEHRHQHSIPVKMEGNHSYDPHVQRLYKCKTQRRKRHEAHKDGFGCDEHPETVVVSSGPQHHGTPRWLAGWLAGCRCELMQDIRFRSMFQIKSFVLQLVCPDSVGRALPYLPAPPSLPLHTPPCHTESQPSLHLPSFHSSRYRFYSNWNSERKSQDQSTNQPTNHQSRPQTLQPHTLARDTGKEERNGQRNGVGEMRNGMGRGTKNGVGKRGMEWGNEEWSGETRNGMGR
ncbi:hypothetical protein Pcinc_039608 [Petrolisthes cinctipes]|uniref:Uncharacterized protein n=1 Tax=Petrolisthes cinctipes TaxID=88211 RepID=A0AAE1BNC5_PETCI|nr:hypothetical protein Pcinc_039608 [Petrolisthes cinctipes]